MGLMKKYSQFLKELPSKKVVFAFGRFNPPTTGHELLVKAVKKLAASSKADHAIYASKTQDAKKNPLSVDKKVHYLDLMFPGTNFVAANPNERTFIEAAKSLNKRYKNLIMVAGSDRVPEYEKILTKYNGKDFHFDTIQVISAGERDPDSDDASGMSASKMRALASKGDYSGFKKGLPSSMREIDGKRLMNDVRLGMGLDMVKEQVKFTIDELREAYYKGEIFNKGELVEANGKQYEIVDRGSNYLVLVDEAGIIQKKWIQDVTLCINQIKEDIPAGAIPSEVTFKGYTTKNLHHSEDAIRAFLMTIERAGDKDPVAVLNALKATDTYMRLNDLHKEQGQAPTQSEIIEWANAHAKAKEYLENVGEFMHHEDYWHMHRHELELLSLDYRTSGQDMNEELTDKTLKANDKIKVARMVATILSVDNAESSSNPEQLVNNGLRKARNKALNPEALNIIKKMLALATEVGIKFDTSLVPEKLKEAVESPVANKNRMSYKDFKKNLGMNKAAAVPKPSITTDNDDMDPNDHDDQPSDAIDDVEAAAQAEITAKEPHRAVGGLMTPPFVGDDNLRRRKVQYHIGEDKDLHTKHQEIRKKSGLPHPDYYKDLKKSYDIEDDKERYSKQSEIKKKYNVKEESELEEGTFKYHMDKAIAADQKGDVKKKTYHLDNARTAKFAMKSADYSKNKELLDKHKQMTEATDDTAKASKEADKAAMVAKQAKEKEALAIKQQREREDLQKEGKNIALPDDSELLGVPNQTLDAYVDTEPAIGKVKSKMEDTTESDDISDDDIDKLGDDLTDDDYLEAYDDDELSIVDDSTGEEIEDDEEEKKMDESALMEVLSRAERMRGKMRLARSKSKRERATRIALKSYSSSAKINKRARRLAIQLMKKRILRGRDLNKISVGEKERIEKTLEKRKVAIGRLAMKLAPRVRKIEKERLSHHTYTKGK